MKATVSTLLLVAMVCSTTIAARPQLPPDTWRRVAEKMPIGSVVKLRTISRERLTAVLFAVDDSGITVRPKTRIPEPARRIAYEKIDDLHVDNSRSVIGKAAAIGAAIGGGFFAMLFLLAASSD